MFIAFAPHIETYLKLLAKIERIKAKKLVAEALIEYLKNKNNEHEKMDQFGV